jgi:hypothetical protein
MKPKKIIVFAVLIAALLWPTAAFARENFDDRVIMGGTLTLESGETHQGSLVIFGGAVTTEPESIVNGDVVLIGGTVEIGGTVNGNVVGIGGAVRLTETAAVNGDVATVGAALRREDGALVTGQIVNGINIPFSSPTIEDGQIAPLEIPDVPQPPRVTVSANPFVKIIWFFFRTFLYAALAVLVLIFLPKHVDRVAEAALSQPVITAGAGLLTAVLAPLALIVITITIILIPVTILTVIVLAAAWLFGWVALGLEIGRRIAKAINVELAPAIAAGIGTFILLFVLGGFRELIACVGWLPQTLVGLWGLGAVLMTRFGTQHYPINGQEVVESPPEQLSNAAEEEEPKALGSSEEELSDDAIPDDGLNKLADDSQSADSDQ